MNDDLIIEVRKFKTGQISRCEFLRSVNDIILKIPIFLRYPDNDLRYEFYAHVIAKLERMISSYKEMEKAKFTTWFNLVLKREFYNFIKKRNKSENLERDLLADLANENILYTQACDSMEDHEKKIEFQFLTEKEKTVVSLKYGIRIGDRDIQHTTNEMIEKLEKKRKLEKLASKRYFKLVGLQKSILKETDPELIEDLKKEEIKIKKSKKRMERIINSTSVLPTNKWVGSMLGISEGTVAAYLNKIKNKMLKNYKDVPDVQNV
jgi:hypothetical protein